MKRTDSGALVMNKSDMALSEDITDPSIDEKVNEQLAEAKETLGDTFFPEIEASEYSLSDTVAFETFTLQIYERIGK